MARLPALGPLVPRSRKQRASPRAGCRSHRMLLTPTVSVPAVLGHGGPGTGGGEALSLSWLFSRAAGCWRWEAPCPCWAQFAQTLRMLLWRWWEGVGRRREEKADEPSSASQARVHTNTSVTPSLPRPTPRARRQEQTMHCNIFHGKHTQINSTPSHTLSKNLAALASHRNTQTNILHYSGCSKSRFLEQIQISTNM